MKAKKMKKSKRKDMDEEDSIRWVKVNSSLSLLYQGCYFTEAQHTASHSLTHHRPDRPVCSNPKRRVASHGFDHHHVMIIITTLPAYRYHHPCPPPRLFFRHDHHNLYNDYHDHRYRHYHDAAAISKS